MVVDKGSGDMPHGRQQTVGGGGLLVWRNQVLVEVLWVVVTVGWWKSVYLSFTRW